MNLDIYDYNFISYICELSPISSEIVFEFIANISETQGIINYFEFSYGFSLIFNEVYTFTCNIFFFGVPAYMNGSTQDIPSDLNLALIIADFSSGYGNLIGQNILGICQVSEIITCELNGTFRIWGTVENGTLRIDDKLHLNTQGFLFNGIYFTNLSLESSLSDFSNATWAVNFAISSEDISFISANVSSNLNA